VCVEQLFEVVSNETNSLGALLRVLAEQALLTTGPDALARFTLAVVQRDGQRDRKFINAYGVDIGAR